MKKILFVFFLGASCFLQALVIDDFHCFIHAYTPGMVPVTVTSEQSIVRHVISRNAGAETTYGMGTLEGLFYLNSDETLTVKYEHKYYHLTKISPLGAAQESAQMTCSSLVVNNRGSYYSCNPSTDPRPVAVGKYPEYNAFGQAEHSLINGKYMVVAGCDWKDSHYYPADE